MNEPQRFYDTPPFVWPQVRAVDRGAPMRWLRKGLADLRAAPVASLFYGAALR